MSSWLRASSGGNVKAVSCKALNFVRMLIFPQWIEVLLEAAGNVQYGTMLSVQLDACQMSSI